jgi:hypothetical protein
VHGCSGSASPCRDTLRPVRDAGSQLSRLLSQNVSIQLLCFVEEKPHAGSGSLTLSTSLRNRSR